MSIRRNVPIEHAEWLIAPPATWVAAREPEWDFAPPDGYPLAFLLIDEQHHTGSQAVAQRTVRRPLTHAAVQALGQVEIEFDPAAQRLVIHELAVWRRDAAGGGQRRSFALRENFLIRQREQQMDQQMLNGRASVVALVEDLRIGDAIDLAWTLEPRDPLPGLRCTVFHAFGWTVPVARTFFALHRAAADGVRWALHLPPGVTPPVEEIQTEQAMWTLTHPPVLVPEPNAPEWAWPFPLLEVTGWADWKEVAEFAAELWREALADGAEAVAAEAARLRVSGEGAPVVAAAIRFVQEDLRYLAVDFGHGAGLLPNGAGTVLRRRFGDCKDKAVLLTALLRALGVEAWPLLVGTGWQKAVARMQPSTAAFNHAIVTFMADGARHFVDPTLIGQGGDFAHRQPPPYGCGLEVRSGATALLMLPERPAAELVLTEIFTLDARGREGAVEQRLHATAWLADDVRAELVRGGAAAFFKARTEALQRHFPALRPGLEAPRVSDDLAANTLQFGTRYALPGWGPAGEKPPPFFRYGAHGLFLAIELLDGPEQRRQPWLLRHPLSVRHRVVVRGKGVRRARTVRQSFAGPGFRYVCEVRGQRRAIVFDYHWESTQREIAPADWPAYCRERARALEHAGALVRLSSPWAWLKVAALVVAGVGVMVGAAVQGKADRRARTERMRTAEREMGTASAALRRGDFLTAEPLFEKLDLLYSGSLDFQHQSAEAALETGHFDRARQAIAAARRMDSSDLIADVYEALLREKNGDLPGARGLLEKVLARSPNEGPAIFALARVAGRLGDAATARPLYEKALALYPAQPDALQQYALLLWRTGDHERADAALLGAIRAQPAASAQLEGVLADYLSATGRPGEAAAAAQRAAELAPDEPAAAYRLAMSRGQTGDLTGALAVARTMTGRFPQSPLAWNALATATARAHENAEADRAFRAWQKLTPGQPQVAANYGFFLLQTGHPAEARTMLETAARDFPGDGLVWLNYADVLETVGEPAAAEEARRKAAALLPPEQRATLLR